MAHITLSIPDAIYEEMKKHPEIKWSEIARQTIIQKTMLLSKEMRSSDILKLLPPDARKSIEIADEKEAFSFYKKMEKMAWKRKKYLIQA